MDCGNEKEFAEILQRQKCNGMMDHTNLKIQTWSLLEWDHLCDIRTTSVSRMAEENVELDHS